MMNNAVTWVRVGRLSLAGVLWLVIACLSADRPAMGGPHADGPNFADTPSGDSPARPNDEGDEWPESWRWHQVRSDPSVPPFETSASGELGSFPEGCALRLLVDADDDGHTDAALKKLALSDTADRVVELVAAYGALGGDDLNAVMRLPRLRQLMLWACNRLTNGDSFSAEGRPPLLWLTVVEMPQLTTGLIEFVEHVRSIRRLYLDACSSIGDDYMASVVRAIRSLDSLVLIAMHHVGDRFIEAVATHHPDLRELVLSAREPGRALSHSDRSVVQPGIAPQVSMDALAEWLPRLAKLETLGLSRNLLLDDRIGDVVSELPLLRTLRLRDCPGMHHFRLSGLGKLELLDLGGFRGEHFEGLDEDPYPRPTRVDLFDLPRLTDFFFSNWLTNGPFERLRAGNVPWIPFYIAREFRSVELVDVRLGMFPFRAEHTHTRSLRLAGSTPLEKEIAAFSELVTLDIGKSDFVTKAALMQMPLPQSLTRLDLRGMGPLAERFLRALQKRVPACEILTDNAVPKAPQRGRRSAPWFTGPDG